MVIFSETAEKEYYIHLFESENSEVVCNTARGHLSNAELLLCFVYFLLADVSLVVSRPNNSCDRLTEK